MPTLDAGAVTVPEPSWCAGHAAEPLDYRADIHHAAPEHIVEYDMQALLSAELVEYPFGQHPVPPSVHIEITIPGATMDPRGLEALAAVLTKQAAELRRLALRLAVLRAGGDW
ncbi:DUF6907 domain-containing protein [Streptomyces sp. H27-H5]|uniref:DUF6907 domain-containing protein n=1 Tax=Streptomyces sp. H27-H5 TaxID=2996460 RepID=UPI0022707D4E|nr:hypothetical protein [Streptomyces sp. H27-H5]MCY0962785.1 hypothetical protein [Streptomyces sp. H27-H5]